MIKIKRIKRPDSEPGIPSSNPFSNNFNTINVNEEDRVIPFNQLEKKGFNDTMNSKSKLDKKFDFEKAVSIEDEMKDMLANNSVTNKLLKIKTNIPKIKKVAKKLDLSAYQENSWKKPANNNEDELQDLTVDFVNS